jgi:hypothetical protein
MSVQSEIRSYRVILDLLERHQEYFQSVSYEGRSKDNPLVKYDDLTHCYRCITHYKIDFTVTGPQSKALMAEIRRTIGGKWDKRYVGSEFQMVQQREDTALPEIVISGSRESVCTPRVVGTTTTTVPAREAVPATTVTVDEVEWDCGTLLDDDPPAPVGTSRQTTTDAPVGAR